MPCACSTVTPCDIVQVLFIISRWVPLPASFDHTEDTGFQMADWFSVWRGGARLPMLRDILPQMHAHALLCQWAQAVSYCTQPYVGQFAYLAWMRRLGH